MANLQPLVSVIMPFYNAGAGFQAALRSIQWQTYRNWELLLCDDGSNDGSYELAASLAGPRIHVWSDGKRKGLASRLNECLDRAQGELIARMDADDISFPRRFARQVGFLEEHPKVDLVGCSMLIFGEDGAALGVRRGPPEHEQIVEDPSLGFGLAHPTWMARAEWYRKHRYDPGAIRYEDIELLYRAYPSSRFGNLDETLYGYREMRGGFSKRLKTRLGRVRYLRAHRDKHGFGLVARAAMAEGLKTATDALLSVTGARYAMLRFREQQLTEDDRRTWLQLRRESEGLKPGPTIMVLTTVPETLEGFFVPQLRTLDQSGFDVRVVSSPGPALDRLPLPERVERHGVPIERAPHPLHDVVSLWRLYRLIRRIRPQIVHAHTPKAGLLGMAAARLARVPLRLYTVHGLPLLTRTGMRRGILAAAERASAWLATHSYSVSESVRRVLAEEKLNRRAVVLGNGSCGGVDVENFQPRPGVRATARGRYGLPEDAIVLTFLGRLARDKGIAVLAEAWRDLADQFPQAYLLVAGEKDQSDPVPESVLETLRAHPRVRWIGKVSKEQVPWVYAATDVLALPTFREGLSQVALEAGAAGVPVISSRVPGLDAVVDGVTGILVAPGDPATLREGMARLAGDPALRQRLAEAARAHIVARFSETQVNGLWLAEYLRLTGSPAGRGCPEPATAALAAATGIQERGHSAS